MSQSTMKIIGEIAGIVALAGFVIYIVNTIRGKVKPARSSWFIWSLSGVLLASSYYASGARNTEYAAIAGALGPIAIFLLSLKYHDKSKWSTRDTICVAVALGSAVLWWFSHQPLITLLINLFVDFWGVPATWDQAWHKPENEDKLTWTVWGVCNVLQIFAIEHWTFAVWVLPFYFLIGSGITTVLIWVRPKSTVTRPM